MIYAMIIYFSMYLFKGEIILCIEKLYYSYCNHKYLRDGSFSLQSDSSITFTASLLRDTCLWTMSAGRRETLFIPNSGTHPVTCPWSVSAHVIFTTNNKQQGELI